MVTGTVPHVGGPILPSCAPTVLTGGLPQARVSDRLTCVGPPDVILMGSRTVFVSKLPAARIGDQTVHGGVIVLGLPTVLIGDATSSGVGGAGAGGGAITPAALATAASVTSPAAQAVANRAAAAARAPFCERCGAR
jgi:uncharacterized Zn-binding protein involved in type VI secretion